MTRALSLAHLTLLELPPPQFITVAAQAGFDAVGLRLIAVTETTAGYALMDDPQMLRDTLRALKQTGLRVNDIEFVRLTPAFDPQKLIGFLQTGAELGAKYIVTAPYDPDLGRLADNLADFADLAAGFGLKPVLEFFPWTNVPDFQTALQIVQASGASNIGVLVDTLHFDRSGSLLSDLAATDPALLPFIHLCDAPVHPPYTQEALLHTARGARLIAGQGAIALRDILAQLPQDIAIAVEVPLEHRAGLSAQAVAQAIFDHTQAYLRT